VVNNTQNIKKRAHNNNHRGDIEGFDKSKEIHQISEKKKKKKKKKGKKKTRFMNSMTK
jgi:hypothetical protein